MPSWTAVRHLQGRRLGVLAVAVALAAAISLALTLSNVRATSGGDPYSVPAVTDTNPDPNIVETTIIADEATVDLGNGVTANAQTFNGSIPGPTFHLKVGDQVIVHYENHLASPSAIHWHGIELSNGMDGTPFTQNIIQPGGTFLYKFTVTRPGLFWYHPHHHFTTNQVFKGLYGMVVVTDPNEGTLQRSGVLPLETKPIVLSDTTVCKSGANDDPTYPSTAPHISGAASFPAQLGPTPKSLCETPTAVDDNGDPMPQSYAGNDIPAIQTKASFGRVNEGQTVLTNGKNVGARAGDQNSPGALAATASKLDVQAGQGLRLQILNAATTRYMRLHLSSATGQFIHLIRVGGEGGLLNNAVEEGGTAPFDTGYAKGEILIPPGSRADVVAAIPSGLTGVLTLWTEDYKRTGGGTMFPNTPTVPVMHLNVTGNAPLTYTIADGTPLRAATGDLQPTLGPANNNLLIPGTFPGPLKKGTGNENIQLTAQMNNHLGVDTFTGKHDPNIDYTNADHLHSTRYALEGTVLELTTENTTGARHPFHLHGFSIQPLSLTKSGGPNFTWPYPEFRDNVDIPAHYTLRFRVRLEPRPMPDGVTPGGAIGRWLFHCHIFFHAEDGMISELVIVPAADGNERPNIQPAVATSEFKQGETAEMVGKFKDPEGDPVTLSSSVGTMTDDGGGNWSWKFNTGQANSQVVYVTATDSGGRKGQAAFQLLIDNTAPTLVVPGTLTFPAGSRPSFGISATDPDAVDTLTFGASGLPAGLAFEDNGNRTGTVSGQVTAAPGDYLVTYTVTDGHNAPVAAQRLITITKAKKPLTVIVKRPARLVNKRVSVGCLLDSPALRRCQADILVGKKRVGRATKTLKSTGKSLATVKVLLNKATRKKIAKSVPGLKVKVRVTGRRFGSAKNLTDATTTRVVAPKVTTTLKSGGFAPGAVTLTNKGTKFLKGVAKQVGKANKVSCTAAASTTALSTQRGNAACATLALSGLKSKQFTTVAKQGSSPSIAVAVSR